MLGKVTMPKISGVGVGVGAGGSVAILSISVRLAFCCKEHLDIKLLKERKILQVYLKWK